MKYWFLSICGVLILGFGISYFVLVNSQPRPIPKIKLSYFSDLNQVADSFALRLQFELNPQSEILFVPLEENAVYLDWVNTFNQKLPQFKAMLGPVISIEKLEEFLKLRSLDLKDSPTLIFLKSTQLKDTPIQCLPEQKQKLICLIELVLKTQKKKKSIPANGYASLIYQIGPNSYFMGLNHY